MKSAVLNYLNGAKMKGEEVNRADIAASFQKAVVDVLVEHTMQAAKDFHMDKVAIAGGVASNKHLREAMEKACKENGFRFYRPSPIFCTDNGAMIGVAAYYEYMKGTRQWVGSECWRVPNLENWESDENDVRICTAIARGGQDRERGCTAKYRSSFWKYRATRCCIIPCVVFQESPYDSRILFFSVTGEEVVSYCKEADCG